MSVSTLFTPFHELVKSYNLDPVNMVAGQIAFVPCIFLNEVPLLVECERASPTDHFNVKMKIRNANISSDFKQKSKLPIAGLSGLGSTEELLAAKAKLRPCILISRVATEVSEDEVGSVAKKSHFNKPNGIFLPLFGVQSQNHQKGIPQEMRSRVDSLMYKQFFYFPQWRIAASKKYAAGDESVGRLDKLFAASLHAQGMLVTDIKISDEVLVLLRAWASLYLELPLAEQSVAYVNQIIECISE